MYRIIMEPLMPLMSLLGTIQLDKSQKVLHCNPPYMIKSMCPPQIMLKLAKLEKYSLGINFCVACYLQLLSPCSHCIHTTYDQSRKKQYFLQSKTIFVMFFVLLLWVHNFMGLTWYLRITFEY